MSNDVNFSTKDAFDDDTAPRLSFLAKSSAWG